MGWSFRKSLNLGGGTRLNISKKGIGISAGIRGLRIGTGPRGTYIYGGSHGFNYRTKIAPGRGQQGQNRSQSPSNSSFSTIGTPIPTVQAADLVDTTAAQLLEQINESISRPVATPWVVLLVGLMLVLWVNVNLLMAFVLALISVPVILYLNAVEQKNKRHLLTFDNLSANTPEWQAISQAFATLSRAQRTWRVNTYDPTFDFKHNAGATAIINRTECRISRNFPPYLISNVQPFSLQCGRYFLSFFPDRIFVFESGRYGAIAYDSLRFECEPTSYIESGALPSDALVTSYTWQYINKDGGPDRRFNDNRQFPVASYGALRISSIEGLNLHFQVSSLPVSHQFFQQIQSITTPQRVRPSVSTGTPSAKAPSGGNAGVKAPSVPPRAKQLRQCYSTLGLSEDCTLDEARQKLHELAQQYHPDLVSRAGPDIRKFAEERMKEINEAYAEIRKIKS